MAFAASFCFFFRGYTPLALSFRHVIRTSIRNSINTDTSNTGRRVDGELVPAQFAIRSQVPFSIISIQCLLVKSQLPLKSSFCHSRGSICDSTSVVNIIFIQSHVVKCRLPLKTISFIIRGGVTRPLSKIPVALQENHPLETYQWPLRHHFVFSKVHTPLR